MEEKKSFLEQIADQLNKWDKQIEDFTETVLKKKDEIREDVKTEYNKRIDDLKVKKDEFVTKVDEIKKSSDSAWTSLKSGIEKAASELKNSFVEAKNQFSKDEPDGDSSTGSSTEIPSDSSTQDNKPEGN